VKNRFIFLFSIFVFLSLNLWGNLIGIFNQRLNDDISYKKLLLQNQGNQLQVNKYDSFYQPYFSISTNKNAISFGENGFEQLGFDFNTKFLNFYGYNIGITIPYNFYKEENIVANRENGFGNWSINISTDLFPEWQNDYLRKKADLLDSNYQIIQRKWTILSEIINDVFDFIYYNGILQIYEERYKIYLNFENEANDEKIKNSYKKTRLGLEKSILEIKSLLLDYEDLTCMNREEIFSLYKQIISTMPHFREQILGNWEEYCNNYQIQAYNLRLSASKNEQDNWLLAYIPNPKFNFGAAYLNGKESEGKNWDERFSWNFSVSFSIDILDRGEMDYEALQRKENYTILSMEYFNLISDKENRIKKILIKNDMLDIDLKIKDIDLEDALDSQKRSSDLKELGFLNQQDLILKVTDVQMKELERAKIIQQIINNYLNLAKETGMDFEVIEGVVYEN